MVRRVVADEHAIAVEDVVLLRAGGIPKTSSGKIQRHACRDGYLASTLDVLDATS
jgi:acyl-coenzyme A synthetase/AMP-(fatty) acid ligase